uniref:Secreted protein n=1 Tax=Anopheles atroparvus TaxID=41427 RepID=A0AAG5D7S5_ANOAO
MIVIIIVAGIATCCSISPSVASAAFALSCPGSSAILPTTAVRTVLTRCRVRYTSANTASHSGIVSDSAGRRRLVGRFPYGTLLVDGNVEGLLELQRFIFLAQSVQHLARSQPGDELV